MRVAGRPGGSRRRGSRNVFRLVLISVSALLVVSLGVFGGTALAAAVPNAASATTCSGTPMSPATLAGGTYSSVTVTGACCSQRTDRSSSRAMSPSKVPKGALVAAFAHNAHGAGTSGITVHGNILVGKRGEPDLRLLRLVVPVRRRPEPRSNPTLNSPDFVDGDVIATEPLGVVVHGSTIAGDVRETGGGGGAFTGPGANCTADRDLQPSSRRPSSATTRTTPIGGNVWVTGVQSCWLGVFRDKVGGSVTFLNNTMADPDADEVLTNQRPGQPDLRRQLPGRSDSATRAEARTSSADSRSGQCGFGVRKPNPARRARVFRSAADTRNTGRPAAAPLDARRQHARATTSAPRTAACSRFGAPFFGSAAAATKAMPYVGIATAPGGRGYWLANRRRVGRGNFGPNGRFFGSAASFTLNQPVVGIAAAPGGDGYWEATGDGGVFGFGPAAHLRRLGRRCAPDQTDRRHRRGANRQRLRPRRLRRRRLHLRSRCPLPRLYRRHKTQPADRRDGDRPDHRRVLAGRGGRRRVQLRRPVLRVARQRPPQPADRRHRRRADRRRLLPGRPPTAGCSPSAPGRTTRARGPTPTRPHPSTESPSADQSESRPKGSRSPNTPNRTRTGNPGRARATGDRSHRQVQRDAASAGRRMGRRRAVGQEQIEPVGRVELIGAGARAGRSGRTARRSRR